MAFDWPGTCRGAVTLSYDDAKLMHHTEVAPLLTAHGVRGTFYTPINSGLLDHADAWRAVAADGHELGNHSVFHPCRRTEGPTWPEDPYNLRDYTPKRFERELVLANQVLRLIDGRDARTYGNTCHNTEIGEGDAAATVAQTVGHHFPAIRGGRTNRPVDPAAADLGNLGCVQGDFRPFSELRDEIEQAVDAGLWIIYCIHAVGHDERLMIDADEHRQLVAWLSEQRERIWTAPLLDVAQHLRQTSSH